MVAQGDVRRSVFEKAIRHQMSASYQHGMLDMYRYGHAVA